MLLLDEGHEKGRDIQTDKQAETECLNPVHRGFEARSVLEILAVLLEGQQGAFLAVADAFPALETAIEAAAIRLGAGTGRIIYAGAGTSGRLAVLDGTEMPPTFGWPASRLSFLFAGGDTNPENADEGAEDDEEAGARGMKSLDAGAKDVVLGVAASGRTPFTRAVLREARTQGALTISFANNPGSPLLKEAEHGILLRTGSEVLAGSTRLAAGTSQKVALNLFSTTLMTRLNRVHDGQMVDMKVSNEKLAGRARQMVMDITGCSPEAARSALEKADNHAKLAVLLVQGRHISMAREQLNRHKGNLAAAMAERGNGGESRCS